MLTVKIDTTLNLENIQTGIRITRASWFCVLFLNVWYLLYISGESMHMSFNY